MERLQRGQGLPPLDKRVENEKWFQDGIASGRRPGRPFELFFKLRCCKKKWERRLRGHQMLRNVFKNALQDCWGDSGAAEAEAAAQSAREADAEAQEAAGARCRGAQRGHSNSASRRRKTFVCRCIYALVFRGNLPQWYGPPRPWATAQRLTIWLFKAAYLPYLPLFPHVVKFLANTMQFSTTYKDYDSINKHSRQSHPPQVHRGGWVQTMTMPRGEGKERRWSIYIHVVRDDLSEIGLYIHE